MKIEGKGHYCFGMIYSPEKSTMLATHITTEVIKRRRFRKNICETYRAELYKTQKGAYFELYTDSQERSDIIPLTRDEAIATYGEYVNKIVSFDEAFPGVEEA